MRVEPSRMRLVPLLKRYQSLLTPAGMRIQQEDMSVNQDAGFYQTLNLLASYL